ncbi:MAG: glutamate racemase [Holophagales bacterium]|nr:glutamate racemase [Holophagales bacterium]
MSSPRSPFTVGIFDSGVGGLSVLRAIRALRQDVNIHFVADQAHVPYGSRPLEQVREFATGITNYLLKEGADLVVAACNAASAAALHSLREDFPQIPFVGMEPAVKPAANLSSSGTVGVLATPATFQGKLYASVMERFAANVQVLTSTCSGLVQSIEAGDLDGTATRSILEEALNPMLEAGADSIVLGCTHYPFVIPLIKSIVGTGVEIIDPSPAVARQVDRLLNEKTPDTEVPRPSGRVQFCTTGSPAKLSELSPVLIGESHPVHALRWEGGKLLHT